MMLRRLRSRRSPRGQAIVEFALVAPIFILIILGLFDAGRAVYAYNTAANAAREGARIAIVNQDPVAIRAGTLEAGVGLRLTNANVTLTPCSGWMCTYSVTVEVPYEAVTPFIGDLFDPTIRSTASMPVEFENP
jgi:Flp pilus assembly protein TadG